jgi:hypothetical protein
VNRTEALALGRQKFTHRRTGAFVRRQAREWLEKCGGLKGAQLERWHARLEARQAARGAEPKPVPEHIAEFRRLLEKRNTLTNRSKP